MDQLKPSTANLCRQTPLDFLERAAIVYGDCPSIIYSSTTTFTWSQTHRRCLQLASSISTVVDKSQVVSVVAPNTPAMYELQFAVPMSGAILNNINTRFDPHAVSVILQHSQSKLVFVDSLSLTLVLHALSLFPSHIPTPPLVLINDLHSTSSSVSAVDLVVDTYDNMVAKGDPGFVWVRPASEWDPMVLNYTSGTTSAPKGVVHCHRALFLVSLVSIIDWSVPKNCVYLWTLPMFHANGWCFPWAMAAVGGTNICLRKFDGPVIYDLIQKHRVTHMCAAPVVLNMLVNHPRPDPLPNPVCILTGGAPPPSSVLLRAESLGFVVSHGYGLTETAGVVVSCAWKPEWGKFPVTEKARLKARQGVGTVGTTEVDVVDPDSGLSVKRNGSDIGEIVIRGGCVMLGYLKDPETTSRALKRNGWFYTGDVGVMHPDGYLEIKDRSKDVIISGGENLSSVEVESVLYTHAAVNEAAVVARPDEFWGETPCAFVSLKGDVSPRPTEKEIIEYCRGKLPSFMVPKTVVFKEELPKTSTGKIQKSVLREIAKSIGSSSASTMISRL
ncbi:PREDICTED: probable acyl-activating enzyme 6 [Fragaria vesca subsp. vesca]|uniref:probable acyl-activating enzyme 6 n=1 Tax=Fragaria vesca subsp. vesca TaxID=101020 RepID=UPI0002C30C96|nr:PREDICTED: probable acyl-activating enzyme 6 [Fragaria vesca subsp. vesca]